MHQKLIYSHTRMRCETNLERLSTHSVHTTVSSTANSSSQSLSAQLNVSISMTKLRVLREHLGRLDDKGISEPPSSCGRWSLLGGVCVPYESSLTSQSGNCGVKRPVLWQFNISQAMG